MFKKLFSIFAALTLSVGLWAANSVITYTSTAKLYPGNQSDFRTFESWTQFQTEYPEFAGMDGKQIPMYIMTGQLNLFDPQCFRDANGQVLGYTLNYNESTQTGTITFDGELVTIYGDVSTQAFRCNALTSITFPEGLTTLGIKALYGLESLTSVTLPESLTKIEMSVFQNSSSLTSINIPANVTEIGSRAFNGCTGLADVHVAWEASLPTLGEEVFRMIAAGRVGPSGATLHIPSGSMPLYLTADTWKDFGTIVEYVPQAIKDTAIAAVNAVIAETDNDHVKAIATNAATAINAATSKAAVEAIKSQAIANIASAKAVYGEAYTEGETAGDAAGYARGKEEGKAEGLAEAQAALPTDGTSGPAVVITQGDKSITLINPDEVRYTIVEE